MIKTTTFELRTSRTSYLVTSCILLGLAFLLLVLPFKLQVNPLVLGFLVFSSLALCFVAWIIWQAYRRFPQAGICVDQDGFWPIAETKDMALVSWSRVAGFSERYLTQRLDVLDDSGRIVARLEYQLQDFSSLLEFFISSLRAKIAMAYTGVYKKSTGYHVFTWLLIVLVVFISVYVWQFQPWLSLFMLIPLIRLLWSYWNTPYGLQISQDALEIYRPGRCQRIMREAVASVQQGHLGSPQAFLYPVLGLFLKDQSKTLLFKGLNISTVELCERLLAWQRDE